MVDVNGYKIKREKEPDYVTPNHITSQDVCRTTRHYDSSFLKTNHFDTIVSYDNIPDQPPCFFILTLRSVMWSVLTLITTGLVSASVLSPSWIISDLKSSITPNKTLFNYWQSVGLINECHVSTNSADVPPTTSYVCGVYVTGFDMPANEFPDLWKSAVIFLFLSAVLLTFTSITSVLSFCVQAIFKKSIFTVSGLIQSIAALHMILGQLLFLAGWGSSKVKTMCGERSGPFLLHNCHIGVAMYGCMAATAMVFVCALISIQAENATSTDQVEKEINDGNTCVCIP